MVVLKSNKLEIALDLKEFHFFASPFWHAFWLENLETGSLISSTAGTKFSLFPS